MPPAPRIRPYKDFLTPALHRRFALATVTLTGLCYAEAVAIGEWNSLFWTWFPFGRAGIRTGLLFLPAFMIFILRVAQLHVGIRTSYSPFETFTRYSFRFETVQTAGWYLLSAYFYSEVYIWSQPKSGDMNRIKIIPKTDRPSLNERPIYLTSYLVFLALLQTVVHLNGDYDRIDMPSRKTTPGTQQGQQLRNIVPPSTQIKARFPLLVTRSLLRTFALTIISPIIYSLTIRNFAWSFTRSFAKIFWNLPKSGALPAIAPFHYSLLLKTWYAGFLLTLLWEVGNALFSVYVAQDPLKNERPITFESKDPNGSLLTGLKGKKLQTRAFAFWELVFIAQDFQGRRKNIFEDIDRKGGTTWSQILAACLDVVTGVDARIDEYKNPLTQKSAPEEPIPSLPRLGQPLKDGFNSPGDIFTSPVRPKSKGTSIAQAVGGFAKSHGQSPPPKPKKLLEQAENVVLTPEQKQLGLSGLFRDWAVKFLKTNVGVPFRQDYRRRIATIVLGSPYGDVGIIVDAVDSLTKFAVHSLTEDKFGNVQRDVKLIIQTFTGTILKLEDFKATLDFHWTDMERKRESPGVEMILTALREGLDELIKSFGNYSEDLRLSQSEMRMAREAASAKTELQMTQVSG
ncbi:nucleoporin protein Ndc1-Nup [Bisporella sp. PMI_857]|nr:nucleoporin protein Ndc1-Nup [Bisporella sp. PMI_857]